MATESEPPATEGLVVRPFQDADAEPLSRIIGRCLREVNAEDYPAELIDTMCRHFTPDTMRRLAAEREVFVADWGGRPVGTVSLEEGYKVFVVFVDQDLARRGIGNALMERAERRAAALGHGVHGTRIERDDPRLLREAGRRVRAGRPIPNSGSTPSSVKASHPSTPRRRPEPSDGDDPLQTHGPKAVP